VQMQVFALTNFRLVSSGDFDPPGSVILILGFAHFQCAGHS